MDTRRPVQCVGGPFDGHMAKLFDWQEVYAFRPPHNPATVFSPAPGVLTAFPMADAYQLDGEGDEERLYYAGRFR